jgi:hypothetical protein
MSFKPLFDLADLESDPVLHTHSNSIPVKRPYSGARPSMKTAIKRPGIMAAKIMHHEERRAASKRLDKSRKEFKREEATRIASEPTVASNMQASRGKRSQLMKDATALATKSPYFTAQELQKRHMNDAAIQHWPTAYEYARLAHDRVALATGSST